VQQAGIGFDKPQNLGKDQTGGHQCGPIWNEFMKVALKDQPNIDFAVPVGMSLLPTGDGAIEAYKPGQTPGAQTDDSLLAGASSLDSPDGVNIFLTRHLATLSVKAVSINRPSFDMRQ
jgi:membrane carboxypeptidase/penicillin-binding protein